MRSKFLYLILLLAVLIVPDGRLAKSSNSKINVVGSTTVLPIASRAAEEFVRLKGGAVTITVNPGGSGVGVNSVGTGRADIGMVSRELSAQEIKKFQAADLQVHGVGLDRVVCAVSAEIYQAGVHVLSKQNIRDIYLGKITHWNQVGGPHRKIVVVDKERHRGTRQVFMDFIFGDPAARAPAARLVTGSNNEEQTKIAQSDAAIGMLSLAWMNVDVRGVAIEDQGITYDPAKMAEYPIVRRLNLVTQGEPHGLVKEFIQFIQGPAGHKIVQQSGYSLIDSTKRNGYAASH